MSRGSPWAHSISRALGKNARPQICAFQTPCEGSHTGTVGTCAAVGFPWKPLRARFATTLDNTPSLCELGANRGLVSIRAQSHSQKSGGEVKSSKKGEEDKGIVRRLDYNAALTVSRLNLKVEPLRRETHISSKSCSISLTSLQRECSRRTGRRRLRPCRDHL